MDWFIDQFNEFKVWLYSEENKNKTMAEVKAKFEELGLPDCF